ncbi:MAG: DUF3251 domain-containing protein [Pseudoxanthomonas suwonensis]|nr:DUF3251 domain-containing protein [Pseudoxanthomonas suwonensis]
MGGTIAFATGCVPSHSNESRGELDQVRSEVESLKVEFEELKKRQAQDDIDRLFKGLDQIAFLQPGDTGYSTVRYDLGVLTVELADISAYANGSKASIKFGNPLASTVTGLKIKLEWGKTDEDGVVDNDSAKSKQLTLTEPLLSGSWTTVPVVLEGVPPAELGFVRVREVAHTGIRLR